MKINIEKYLHKKRQQLDVEQLDDMMLWEGIRKEIPIERKIPRFNFWRAAAIFLAIFTVSYVVYNEMNKEKDFTLSEINQSLGEREKEYKQLILLKMQDAKIEDISSGKDDEILLVLLDDLKELDNIYMDAMNDLKQNGHLDQVVEIIFDTYEKRIRILEQIIMETQKLEMYEKDEQKISL